MVAQRKLLRQERNYQISTSNINEEPSRYTKVWTCAVAHGSHPILLRNTRERTSRVVSMLTAYRYLTQALETEEPREDKRGPSRKQTDRSARIMTQNI